MTKLLPLLFVLLCALPLVGCLGEEEAAPSDRVTTIAELSADATAGKTHWDSLCAGCHGPLGKGTPSGDDLTTDEAKEEDNEEVIETILEGEGTMPAYKDSMTDQAIADTAAYLKQLQK